MNWKDMVKGIFLFLTLIHSEIVDIHMTLVYPALHFQQILLLGTSESLKPLTNDLLISMSRFFLIFPAQTVLSKYLVV